MILKRKILHIPNFTLPESNTNVSLHQSPIDPNFFQAYVLKQDNRHIVFLFSAEVPIYALQQLANKAAPIFE